MNPKQAVEFAAAGGDAYLDRLARARVEYEEVVWLAFRRPNPNHDPWGNELPTGPLAPEQRRADDALVAALVEEWDQAVAVAQRAEAEAQ